MNLETKICEKKLQVHTKTLDNIEYYKCERCDGYGNYIVVESKMRCKKYGGKEK